MPNLPLRQASPKSISRVIALFWVGNILCCEWFLPWWWWCATGLSSGPCITGNDSTSSCLIIIADPQLTDSYSYPHFPSLITWIAQWSADQYMRRQYGWLQRYWRGQGTRFPNVLFLGDLTDGGREWVGSPQADQLFTQGLDRFHRIFFPSSKQRPVQLTSHNHIHFMAGNHDIGFGGGISDLAYARFQQTFGPLNYQFLMSHSTAVIVLDTLGLSDPKHKGSLYYRQASALLQNISSVPKGAKESRVLFTHVPLFRPPNCDCGPHRSNPPIVYRRGYQYQNMISPEITLHILQSLQPDVIISGDDHDICVYRHGKDQSGPIEYTIPTFSWLQGQRYPGYGVLSTTESGDVNVQISFLLPLIYIYMWYICCAFMTICVGIMATNRRASPSSRDYIPPFSSSFSRRLTEEAVELRRGLVWSITIPRNVRQLGAFMIHTYGAAVITYVMCDFFL